MLSTDVATLQAALKQSEAARGAAERRIYELGAEAEGLQRNTAAARSALDQVVKEFDKKGTINTMHNTVDTQIIESMSHTHAYFVYCTSV